MVLSRGIALLSLLALPASFACSGMLPQQYEYEEEMYLSLDGSATLYVNSSIAALVALHGLELDTHPRARLDRDAIRRAYTSAATKVTRVSGSRRAGRRFAHVRIEVEDVRRLGEAAPLAWSSYEFQRREEAVVFRQTVGRSAR
jgi:hypothetical protein